MLISKQLREKCKERGYTIAAGKDFVFQKRTNFRIKETSTGNQLKMGILNTISELDFACFDDTSSYSPDFKELLMELVEHIAVKYQAKMVSFSFHVDVDFLSKNGFIPKKETKGYREWEQLFAGSLIWNGDALVKVYDTEANFERINIHKSIVDILEQAGIKDFKIKHQWFSIWVWWLSGDQLRRVDIYPSTQGHFELSFDSRTSHGIIRYAKDQDELSRYIVQFTNTCNIEDIAI
ncbi:MULTISPECIES: hypothetical protein [unclassified Paenibacillus]|uniref:hypothetical protein n=1 Tax=unclassified Paenibacillus TaxID=185978 RepID=UPI0027D8366A|nr:MULTISPECIES: hypothetical protein [unclassified Paenibacillus]